MKNLATFKSFIIVAALVVLALPNTLLAAGLSAPPAKATGSSVFKPRKIKTPQELQKLLDSKVLIEKEFVDNVNRLRLGGNSGGGGDELGIIFQKAMIESLQNLRTRLPEVYASLPTRQLHELAEYATVIVVDEFLDVSLNDFMQSSVAVNIPEEFTILLNRSRAEAIQNDKNLFEAIALHEVLSLKRIESTGAYPVSSQYLSSLGSSVTQLETAVNVDRLKQIKALGPKLSPFEILEKLYLEARQPVNVDIIKNFSQFEKYRCSSITYNFDLKKEGPVTPAAIVFYKDSQLVKEAQPATLGHGPLLPGTPGTPAIYKNEAWFNIGVNPTQDVKYRKLIQASPTEFILKTEGLGALYTDKYTTSIKMSSGMLTYKRVGYYYDTSAQKNYRVKIIGYCYRAH